MSDSQSCMHQVNLHFEEAVSRHRFLPQDVRRKCCKKSSDVFLFFCHDSQRDPLTASSYCSELSHVLCTLSGFGHNIADEQGFRNIT